MGLKAQYFVDSKMLKKHIKKELNLFVKKQEFENFQSTFLITQAHLWQKLESGYSGRSNVLMIGSLSDFYHWFDVQSKFTSAFISYQDENNCLLRGIKTIYDGKTYLGNSIKKFLKMSRLDRQTQLLKTPLDIPLTKSELEILVLMSEGYTTKEIAQFRTRSVHTVKTQKKSIRKKINSNFSKLSLFAGRRWKSIKTLCEIEKNSIVIDNILQYTT